MFTLTGHCSIYFRAWWWSRSSTPSPRGQAARLLSSRPVVTGSTIRKIIRPSIVIPIIVPSRISRFVTGGAGIVWSLGLPWVGERKTNRSDVHVQTSRKSNTHQVRPHSVAGHHRCVHDPRQLKHHGNQYSALRHPWVVPPEV